MLRATRRPIVLLLLVVPMILQGCREPVDLATSLDGPELQVEFTGCKRVRTGPVCVMPEPGSLRLWIRAEPGVELRLNGAPLPAERIRIQDGIRIAVQLAPNARQAEVTAHRGNNTTVWQLPIDSTPRPAWYRQARELLAAGETTTGRRLVETKTTSTDPSEEGLAQSLLARLDLANNPSGAERRLHAAIDARRQSGELSSEIRDATTLAFLLLEQERTGELRRLLDRLPDPAGHADSFSHIATQRGQMAYRTGDLRTARRELAAGWRQAHRLGLNELRSTIEGPLILTLASLGRFDEALDLWQGSGEIGDDLLSGTLQSCRAGQVLNNRAWALLLAREAGEESPDPSIQLRQALTFLANECQNFPEEATNVRLNLALNAVQRGDPASARRWLKEVDDTLGKKRAGWTFWRQEIEARLELAQGKAAAAAHRYRRMELQAQQRLAPEARWRALFGLGQALKTMGDSASALDALARADALLDLELLLVPMHQGRDSFLGSRRAATRHYLDLLLDLGRDTEALAVIRRARSRYLRSLRRFVQVATLPATLRAEWDQTRAEYQAARQEMDAAAAHRWQLPGDQLELELAAHAERLRAVTDRLDRLFSQLGESVQAANEPLSEEILRRRQPGELLLAVHRLTHGWVAILEGDDGLRVLRLANLDLAHADAAELGRQLLDPFAKELLQATDLRVLAAGAMQAVDFHALPFAGSTIHQTTLADTLAVSYGADLLADAPPADRRSALAALVVGDPSGNLPEAREEATLTAHVLMADLARSESAQRVSLLLGEEATPGAVRDQLASGGLFHYAGHARYEGWESYLPLAAHGRLTLDDVMTLERAPAQVVLSGCETASSTASSTSSGTVTSISLAHAFLIAGTEEVVATTRPVSDRESALLFEVFYRVLPEAGTMSEALRQAQLALKARHPTSDWSAFRVMVP